MIFLLGGECCVNSENLKSNFERTPQERKELARKAGLQSGKVRKEKRLIRDALQRALSGVYTMGDSEKEEAKLLCGYDAMALSMIQSALSGDVRAFIAIRDTIGEKPKETVEFEDNSLTSIKIKFVDKSKPNLQKEKDPKIIGEYTPPTNADYLD